MKITIKATNFKLTPPIKNFVEEKINSLEKFLKDKIIEAFVEVEKTTRHHRKGPFFRAETDLRLPKKILRAEAEEKDLYQAIVRVKDELQRQLKKYKRGFRAKVLRGARARKRLMSFDPKSQDPRERDLSKRQQNEI